MHELSIEYATILFYSSPLRRDSTKYFVGKTNNSKHFAFCQFCNSRNCTNFNNLPISPKEILPEKLANVGVISQNKN